MLAQLPPSVMQCPVERAASGPRHMLESTRSCRAFLFDGRQDSYREFWLTASIDELDQRVQVEARILGDLARERAREAGFHQLLAPPTDDFAQCLIACRFRLHVLDR